MTGTTIKAMQFDITLTHDDGTTHRMVRVASDHPRLYELAQEAEQAADRDLMRAVTRAAIEPVTVELTVLPVEDAG